jgi:hypothetical protein
MQRLLRLLFRRRCDHQLSRWLPTRTGDYAHRYCLRCVVYYEISTDPQTVADAHSRHSQVPLLA